MKLQNKFGIVSAMVVLLALQGCAEQANSANMAVTAPPAPAAAPSSAAPAAQPAAPSQYVAGLQGALCVRKVTGGQDTNPLWVSKVGNDGFSAALTTSLQSAGLAGSGAACRYQIDVDLLGLSQPFAGFNLTVTSHVNYKVYDTASTPVLLATISAPYTAKMGDAFLAATRLRLANEGSIRENITQFLAKLAQVQQAPGGQLTWPAATP